MPRTEICVGHLPPSPRLVPTKLCHESISQIEAGEAATLNVQGWLVLLPHWREDEEDGYDMLAVGREVRDRAKTLRRSGLSASVENFNGSDTVLIAAGANRWRGEHDDLIDFVRSVAALAPGSYGLIHFEDDHAIAAGLNDVCQVYVLKRGVLTLEVETRFTPFSANVAE